MSERTHYVDFVADLDRRERRGAASDGLVEQLELSVLGVEDRERTPERALLKSGHADVHELSRNRRARDSRGGEDDVEVSASEFAVFDHFALFNFHGVLS